MRFGVVLAGLLLVMGLAGCTQGAQPSGSESAVPSEIQSIDSAPDKGAIRGIVVTDAIVPIANATVKILSLGTTAKSTANGAFLFKDVEPGTYFVQAGKPGYSTQQTSATVVAGDPNPPVIRLILPQDKTTQPFAITSSWTGFLECGFGTSAGSVNPCAADMANSHNTQAVTFPSGIPQVLDMEMLWDNTQAVSNELSMGIYDPATLASDFSHTSGVSPLILHTSNSTIAKFLGASPASMTQRVFPGGSSANPATVFTNQKFTIYSTFFYRFEPKASWSFAHNGSCTTPEQCGK